MELLTSPMKETTNMENSIYNFDFTQGNDLEKPVIKMFGLNQTIIFITILGMGNTMAIYTILYYAKIVIVSLTILDPRMIQLMLPLEEFKTFLNKRK